MQYKCINLECQIYIILSALSLSLARSLVSLGRVILSRAIETVAMAIANLKIPDVWILKSYPTLKSLASFIKDLQQRIQYFQVIINTQRTINY